MEVEGGGGAEAVECLAGEHGGDVGQGIKVMDDQS